MKNEKIIRLTSALPDEWVRAQMGKYLDDQHYSRLVDEMTTVYKPDGSTLLMLRKGVLPAVVCENARPALQLAGSYISLHRYYGIPSATTGYFDKPDCRTTQFTKTQIDEWGRCMPLIRECDRVFARYLPSRYLPQCRVARHTAPDWVIADTSFTTMTVNRWTEGQSAQTPVHVDKGDLQQGFGVISVVSSGNYTGGYLIFPRYEIAVDMRTTDVLLCDVHEPHCNVPIVGEPGYERIACILYYRTKMRRCGRVF